MNKKVLELGEKKPFSEELTLAENLVEKILVKNEIISSPKTSYVGIPYRLPPSSSKTLTNLIGIIINCEISMSVNIPVRLGNLYEQQF